MGSMEGHPRMEPGIEEVLASIRRVIQAGASPSETTFASPIEIPIEHEPFELPALFRSKEPNNPLPASGQQPAAPVAVSPPPLHGHEPAIHPRILRTFKDTLMARMGQSPVLAIPSSRQPDASVIGEDFCLRPMLPPRLAGEPRPIVNTVRRAPTLIPRARFEHASFLLGRGASEQEDESGVHVAVEPPAQPDASFDVDQTAALLRPILRQWVDDNMRNLVSKALRDEPGAEPETTDQVQV
jgi:cell pole-organizing protein PopZ